MSQFKKAKKKMKPNKIKLSPIYNKIQLLIKFLMVKINSILKLMKMSYCKKQLLNESKLILSDRNNKFKLIKHRNCK